MIAISAFLLSTLACAAAPAAEAPSAKAPSDFQAAPEPPEGADRFAAAANLYREGKNVDALNELLRFYAENPNGAKSEEALRLIWEITQKVKASEQSLQLDPKLWRQTVESARRVVDRRQKEAGELLKDLDTLQKGLANGQTALASLRSARIDPTAIQPAAFDDLSRALAERRLAAIRQMLAKIVGSSMPDAADLHEAKGYLWYYQGDLELTVQEWEQAEKLRPADPALKDRLESARAQWKKQKVRDEVEHEVLLGSSDMKAGRYKNARMRFEKALAMDPGNSQAQRSLERATTAIATASTQERVQALMIVGRRSSDDGRLLDAVQSWVDVLALDPSNTEARASLERIRKRLTVSMSFKQPPAAQTATAKPAAAPATAEAQNAEEAYSLALIRYTDGDLQGAQKEFEEALRLQPKMEKAMKGLEQVKAELQSR